MEHIRWRSSAIKSDSTQSVVPLSEMEQDTSVLFRPALGIRQEIGDLYSSYQDKFTNTSAFQAHLINDAKIKIGDTKLVNRIDMHIIDDSTTLSKRLQHFNIDKALKFSFFADWLDIGNASAANYLKETKTRNILQKALIYRYLQSKQFVSTDAMRILVDESKISQCNDAPLASQATHAVNGVYRGVEIVVVVECADDSVEKTKTKLNQIIKLIEAAVKRASSIVDADLIDDDMLVGIDIDNDEVANDDDVTIRVLTDINQPLLTATPAAVLHWIKQIPKTLIDNCKPIAYDLIALHHLQRDRGLHKIPAALMPSNQQLLLDAIQLLESLVEFNCRIVRIQTTCLRYKYLLSNESLQQLTPLKDELDDSKSSLFVIYQRRLLALRRCPTQSCIEDDDKLQRSIIACTKRANKINQILSRLCFDRKFTFVQDLQNASVIVVGAINHYDYNHIEETIIKSLPMCYVLFYTDSEDKDEIENRDKQKAHFIQLAEYAKLSQVSSLGFVAVNVDQCMVPNYCAKKQTRIFRLKHGVNDCTDVLDNYQWEQNLCFIRTDEENKSECGDKPANRIQLTIKCPCTVDGEAKKWQCFDCRKPIEYGFDGFFYCDCKLTKAIIGGTRLNLWKCAFRCDLHDNHGISFMRYDRERMQTLLDELNNNRETIILLIGQTGSGKTTWINSLANYVRFDSFIEALQHSPTSIVVDANEGANQAYSSTRLPITYTFNDGQNVLRVIDTPGFGDTDGAERDKSNLINILDHIAHYQQLNAIVFCIDAREKRLNEAFIRMIGDLFKFISKDAVDNIIYCMTNASQFDEKDALPAMACIKELAKRSDYRDIIKIQYSNVCCVDNAAFDYWKRKWSNKYEQQQVRMQCNEPLSVRYSNLFNNRTSNNTTTACISESRKKQAISEKWSASYDAMRRMFMYIRLLAPYRTNDIVSLNNARLLIKNMTGPLSKIVDDICDNRKNLEKYEAQKYYINKNRVVTFADGRDRLFCKKCATKSVLTYTGKIDTQWKICRDGDLPPFYSILHFFGHNLCKKCVNCKPKDHCIRNSYQQQCEEIDEELKRSVLAAKASGAPINAILDKKRHEYDDEEEVIVETMAVSAAFLRLHAIIDRESDFKSYLQREIAQLGKQKETDENNMKLKYDTYMEKYGDPADGDVLAEITTENIVQCQQQLYALKFTGPLIENLIKANEKSSTNVVTDREIRITADNGDYYRNFLSKLFTQARKQ